ncbi:MAG: hypothetical protein XD60_0120 [Acetothermia bacterium 64_32]|nr:MAG: hypothetical protein XD60_0120 [Acetothermia bacterium 64_32]HAF70822.1 metal-binding protein [Candidatus Acetothermia bacterium]
MARPDRPTFSVLLLPGRRLLKAKEGENLLFFLVSAGVHIPSDCGGQGICGRCRVRFLKEPPPPTPAEVRAFPQEELKAGWRLACQHRVDCDLELFLPAFGGISQEKAKVGSYTGPLRPAALRQIVELPPPSREERRAFLERFRTALGEEVEVPLSILKEIPEAMRSQGFRVSVVRVGGKVVSVKPGVRREPVCGLALDLGTSTLAAYLLDLEGGKELGAKALVNPQRSFGADVLSRIAYVQKYGEEGIKKLRERVLEGVNELVKDLVSEARIDPEDIVQAVVVGNPTMLHLFLGVDPTPIGQAPFIPVWRESLSLKAHEVGIKINPEALVHTLPMVSGYVGADTVGAVLACGLHRSGELALLLDLGTNGEIVLGNEERMLACSAAAGPAFEGGRISSGMPAVEGAISHVDVDGEVSFRVIGGSRPKGLCGTALVDLVAGLLGAGLIDPSGRLSPKEENPLSSRIRGDGNQRGFLLTGGIELTQRDIRELQLAKAAIRAGVEVLLSRMKVSPVEVDRVFLAGAFGSQMRPKSIVKLGLLPRELLPRIVPVGNAAGTGAKLALLDHLALSEAEGIANRITYIELSAERLFSSKFVEAMSFAAERMG